MIYEPGLTDEDYRDALAEYLDRGILPNGASDAARPSAGKRSPFVSRAACASCGCPENTCEQDRREGGSPACCEPCSRATVGLHTGAVVPDPFADQEPPF